MHTCVTQVQYAFSLINSYSLLTGCPRAPRTGAPWGISRLSQNDRHPGRVTDAFLNSFIYRYGSDAGSGVDIYVVGQLTDTFHSSHQLNFLPRHGHQRRTCKTNTDRYHDDRSLTGFEIVQVDFGGRASWGASFGGYPNIESASPVDLLRVPRLTWFLATMVMELTVREPLLASAGVLPRSFVSATRQLSVL
jgi:hypothetical protein